MGGIPAPPPPHILKQMPYNIVNPFKDRFGPKFPNPTPAPGAVANIPIPRLIFNPVCPAGTNNIVPGLKITAEGSCVSTCPNGFTDMGLLCNKFGFPPQTIPKPLVPPINQTTTPTPLVGSSNTPANATPKQQAAYASYRDLNTSLGKIQTDFEAASKDYNEQVKKYQDLKADLERLYKVALDAVAMAGPKGMPAFFPGAEDKAKNALDTYNRAVRTIEILSGRVQQKDRTPANNSLAKDSLPNLRNTIGNIFNARESTLQKLNAAVAAIATANTEAAEAAARNAKSKNEAEKAKVAAQLAAAQAAMAASASAAVASGAAALTASAAAASAANMATNTQVASKKPKSTEISKQSSNPNSSGKCPNDTTLVDGKCWTKCPAGYIDYGLYCGQMTQAGLQQPPAVLEPVKNTPKKASNLVKENIEILRTHAAMLGGYGKKGRSTRHSKKGVQPRKKRNSGKNTYRRKF